MASESATAFPEPHVIQPEAAHTHTIILLHGRDNNGEDFAEELFACKTSKGKTLFEQLPNSESCKWIFPSAHDRISSVFQEELQEWFDIYSLTYPESERERQVEGLRDSITYIHGIIDEELKTVPADRIILGGISQGFAVSSLVLLSSRHSFAGFVGLCGWMPFQTELREIIEEGPASSALSKFFVNRLGVLQKGLRPTFDIHCIVGSLSSSDTENEDEIEKAFKACTISCTSPARKTPVWISHSKDDSVVEIEHGKAACDTLRAFGFDVTFNEFEEGEHWSQEPQGCDALAEFLSASVLLTDN